LAVDIDTLKIESAIKFSFCTLVTNFDQYNAMLKSAEVAGFTESDCEFVYCDNSVQNNYDAYAAINIFLKRAKGEYIIICHQDVLLIDKREQLEQVVEELEQNQPTWAVAGNAGGVDLTALALRITDFAGPDQRSHQFPQQVHSLDENFLLIKNDARVAVSANLKGFHFYGADLCIVAETLGYSCWVVDYHLEHYGKALSGEQVSRTSDFERCKQALIEKYRIAFRGRFIRTTCTKLYIGGQSFLVRSMNKKWVIKRAATATKMRRSTK
jgi:hypothetical protein